MIFRQLRIFGKSGPPSAKFFLRLHDFSSVQIIWEIWTSLGQAFYLFAWFFVIEEYLGNLDLLRPSFLFVCMIFRQWRIFGKFGPPSAKFFICLHDFSSVQIIWQIWTSLDQLYSAKKKKDNPPRAQASGWTYRTRAKFQGLQYLLKNGADIVTFVRKNVIYVVDW